MRHVNGKQFDAIHSEVPNVIGLAEENAKYYIAKSTLPQVMCDEERSIVGLGRDNLEWKCIPCNKFLSKMASAILQIL